MRGGKLDRLIAIEQNVPTRNTHGEETKAWQNFATVWASKRDKGGREYFEAGVQLVWYIDPVARNATV